jgi:hypothetical protein
MEKFAFMLQISLPNDHVIFFYFIFIFQVPVFMSIYSWLMLYECSKWSIYGELYLRVFYYNLELWCIVLLVF